MTKAELQARLDHLAVRLPGCIPYENRRPLNVPARYGGATVAEVLAGMHGHVAAMVWEEAAAAGRLLRRGTPVGLATRVHAGDQLIHVIPETVEPAVDGRVRVLYLDPELLVVLKPAPLPVHPCGRYNRNSLTGLLAAAVAEPDWRPRPAHRLDANTAGVMALTLSRESARQLQGQFAMGRVGKLYLAEVVGRARAGGRVCREAVGREPTTVGGRGLANDGVAAESRFRTLRVGERSLVAAVPVTGRTNQLRAHLWHLGTPVVGDPFYLPTGRLGEEQTVGVQATAMRLQAVGLRFRHPRSLQVMRFRELPEWLAEASAGG